MISIKKIISLLLVVVMLVSLCAFAENPETKIYFAGNDVTDSKIFGNGVFTAVSEGSGLLAIALYKDDELKKISFAETQEELEETRVNMVIDNAQDYTMKVFRFDENGNPLLVNNSFNPVIDDTKVYINETFDNGFKARGAKPSGVNTVLSDGMVKVKDNYSDAGTRYGTFSVPYTEDYVIFEADYILPSDGACKYAYLLATYYDSGYKAVVYLHPEGIKKSTAGSNNPPLVPIKDIPINEKFNIAVKFNFVDKNYDIYFNRQKVTTSPISISGRLSMTNPTDGFSFYSPMLRSNTAGSDTIYVDNIRVYSGTEFKDIGETIPNVHRHDFDNSANWQTDIYERPEAAELAEKAFETGHPRVLINKSKVNEIKNSTDETIVSIRENVIAKADGFLTANPYPYTYTSSTGSLGNVDDALSMMMYLGMAYQLTGDKKYADRAYKEAQVLFYVPSKDYWGRTGDDRDFWNSYSFLDVSEISTTMAICYDWMYDAWTPGQRLELTKHTMEKGIMRSYRGMFDEYNFNLGDPNDQMTFRLTNNWGAVCNGGMLMTAIAFMETDANTCSQIAEAHLKALEYFLPSYAPAGAWAEGAGYWNYALKYLTMACATLEAIAGTDYGIHKTQGLKESQLFALSCEGKTGVVGFGDVGGGHVNAPSMLYWANKYKDDQIGGARIYSMDEFGFNFGILDLIYYNPEYIDDDYVHPLTSYYKGTEVVTMAAGYEKEDAFFAISGGTGTATSHDHMDSGGIIVEKNGLRVLCDSGAEHYGAKSYFSTNRFWYYKARPEGHNLFVINPQNLKDRAGSYYHGQSKSAYSEITEYSSKDKTTTMDLTGAYSRDASFADRKASIVDQDIIIEDEIELLSDASMPSDGSYIEWYWHYKDTATAVVDNTTKYGRTDYGTAMVSEDGKSVELTFLDYSYNGSKFSYPGTSKKFTLTFESNCDFEIEIRDAVRNPYDADVIAGFVNAGTFSKDYHNSRNSISKIVVKMKNAKGNVKLKTVFK